MIGMHKSMREIFDVVESLKTPISHSQIAAIWGIMIDIDLNELSNSVFAMLNQMIVGEIYAILTDTIEGGGLDVWRMVTVILTDKEQHRRQALFARINSPKRAKELNYVQATLRDWERGLCDYHQGGGADYQSDECKSAFLRQMLPMNSDGLPFYHEFLDGHP